LKTEELQQIIDQFDEVGLKAQGVFGIFQYGGGADESYIRANKEGLELYALWLLKASKESENILTTEGEKIINLDNLGDWIDENSDTSIDYIALLPNKMAFGEATKYQETTMDKMRGIGCMLVVILLLISTIIGVGTLAMWIFF